MMGVRRLKVVTVVGARPQFVKAAVLSRELRKDNDEILVDTGQHYDEGLSAVFFDELDIQQPKYELGVGSGSHARQTAAVLTGVEDVLVREKPDVCVVFGDTNSTLGAALAAAKLGVPVAHVEAGPRAGCLEWPEEINRVAVDHVSSILLCPTKVALENCRNEGLADRAYLTGDVNCDLLRENHEKITAGTAVLDKFGVRPGEFLLATVHRAQNTDDRERLEAIVAALLDAGETVVLPAHPRLKNALHRTGLLSSLEAAGSVVITDPLGYVEFLSLAAHSRMVVTDSGGVQKEAYMLGNPCVTLLERTPWPETVAAGWNVLIKPEREAILQAVNEFEPTKPREELFGDGSAGKRICSVLSEAL